MPRLLSTFDFRPSTFAAVVAATLYAAWFGWLASERHLALRTNAEDLGFSDQVIWNFLRGQFMRFSIYQDAAWTTDIDIAALRRPDSLLAFHVEPIIVGLVPLYLIPGLDVRALLWVQAIGVALGALPAYWLGRARFGSEWAGVSMALLYLLSPLGQWALVADFHTVAWAAPLLMLAVWALWSERRWTFILAGLLATATKEEIGLVWAGLGVAGLLVGRLRTASVAAVVLGVGWSLICVGLIIPHYAGADISPFTARYAHLGGSPGAALRTLLVDPSVYLTALARPEVAGYATILLLGGGWLALFAPHWLAPAAVVLALNMLSSSTWMASGRAHYSASVLPFVVAAATFGGARLADWLGGGRATWAILLVATTLAGAAYSRGGIGPLADGFVAPTVEARHRLAQELVARVPRNASVTASSALAPHLSRRAGVYVFPTVRDADYALIDALGSPAPTSHGAVYQQARDMLDGGAWAIEAEREGLLLLVRRRVTPHLPSTEFFAGFHDESDGTDPPRRFEEAGLAMLESRLVLTGEVGPLGPVATLETSWRAERPIRGQPRPAVTVFFRDGSRQRFDDGPTVWWYPPERWPTGQSVRIDVPNLPLRAVAGWDVEVARELVVAPTAVAPVQTVGPPPPLATRLVEQFAVGALLVALDRRGGHLSITDPASGAVWREAGEDGRSSLALTTFGGQVVRATGMGAPEQSAGGLSVRLPTDDGRTVRLGVAPAGARAVRLSFEPLAAADIASVSWSALATPDERFLGFGERFGRVDQRGRIVHTWAEDRRVAEYGQSSYAPIPHYLSSRGHSLLLESDARSTFDVAATASDRVTVRLDQSRGSLVVAFGTPRELVQGLAQRTGLPPLPPMWAFGTWKTAVGGDRQVMAEADLLRAEGIPASALLLYDATDAAAGIGWPHVGYPGVERGGYPDLRELTRRLAGMGLRSLAYVNPDVTPGTPAHGELAARGMLVRDGAGRPYAHAHLGTSWVDFTHPDVPRWWRARWQRALGELGFAGAMLDLGELVPHDASYADGTTGTSTHNRYLGLYARHSFDAAVAARGEEVVIFARSASLGAQRFHSQRWPGDQLITGDDRGLGGLVAAALSSGLSGLPYWHPEVGGFLSAALPRAVERELWFRWLQFGALSSLLRDQYGEHQGHPVDAWSDAETIAQFRRYARLHDSLVPYLYSLAREASRTGLPIMRHLTLNWPSDPHAWTVQDVYTLGDDLLVAPVVSEGVRSREVYLPAGHWVDWWSGRGFEGGRTHVVEAPLHQIPLFARDGSILPLSLDPTTQPDERARWTGELIVRVVGARPFAAWAAAERRLFDDTRIQGRVEAGRYTLRIEGAERAYRLELSAPAVPSRVEVNGRAWPDWTYVDNVVTVRVAGRELSVSIVP